MSKKAAEHHKQSAEHHTHAARHHSEAARHHESGSHEKAAHHAHTASGHAHDFNAVATLSVWTMTLFIQRANRRDTLALHAKLNELHRVDNRA